MDGEEENRMVDNRAGGSVHGRRDAAHGGSVSYTAPCPGVLLPSRLTG